MNIKRKILVTDLLLGIFGGMLIALFLLYGLTMKVEAVDSQQELLKYIEETTDDYGICPELVQAVIERESNWNVRAVNGSCIGLMQIDPRFHQERMDRLGVTKLTDPKENILVGVDYLAELFREYKDIYGVLMFYNAGYSDENGLRAWEEGRYSDYALRVAERSEELERRNGK